MELLRPDQVNGNRIFMKAVDPRHFKDPMDVSENKKQGFKDYLLDALTKTNADQMEATDLSEKMIVDPDSVDPHDVTVAMAKANLSLSIAKAVVDKTLRAYSEIINLR